MFVGFTYNSQGANIMIILDSLKTHDFVQKTFSKSFGDSS